MPGDTSWISLKVKKETNVFVDTNWFRKERCIFQDPLYFNLPLPILIFTGRSHRFIKNNKKVYIKEKKCDKQGSRKKKEPAIFEPLMCHNRPPTSSGWQAVLAYFDMLSTDGATRQMRDCRPLAPRPTISVQRWAITARINAMRRVLSERNLEYDSNQVETLKNCALKTRVALRWRKLNKNFWKIFRSNQDPAGQCLRGSTARIFGAWWR